jgi:hypothetical protein
MASAADHGSAADQCHIRNSPEKRPVVPSVTVPGVSSASSVLAVFEFHMPRYHGSALTCRFAGATREDTLIFLKTETLLI